MYRLVFETFSLDNSLNGCIFDGLALYIWSWGSVEEEKLQS